MQSAMRSTGRSNLWGIYSSRFNITGKLNLYSPLKGFDRAEAKKIPLRHQLAALFGQVVPLRTQMYDARAIQEQYDSPAAFFDRYGFVLLKSETQVKEWNEDKEFEGENDITQVYHREVESMLYN